MDKFLPYHLRELFILFPHCASFPVLVSQTQLPTQMPPHLQSVLHTSLHQSHKQWEDNNQWQKKNHLSCQRHYNTQLRHTDRGKETGRHRLNPICKSHKHKYFQIAFCKLEIQITSCSEDTHNLVWKYLETEKEYRRNYCTGSYRITVCLSYSVIFLCSVVKSPDWLTA